MKLELHHDLPDKPPYTLVESGGSDEVRRFFEDNGVHCTQEREVFRANDQPYDFLHFQGEIQDQRLADLIEQWNAQQRAAKRGS